MFFKVDFFRFGLATIVVVAAGLTATEGPAMLVYTPVFTDGFAASANSQNANLDIATRQSGPLAPISYVANTANVNNDYHHQVFGSGGQPLQLAGDSSVPGFTVLVSPNYNFSGPLAGEILGKRITFSFNVGTGGTATAGSYLQGGVNIGGNSTLVQGGTAVPHFGVRFVEDRFSGGPQFFLQFFDGNVLVANLLTNPAGAARMEVQFDVDDPIDGNPWDGVGSTKIDVLVGPTVGTIVPVGSYTKGGGGYLNNFITLEGSANLNGVVLATHIVDNLVVFRAAAVPESTAIAGLSVVLLGLCAIKARWRRN